jgi:hypothetical protein
MAYCEIVIWLVCGFSSEKEACGQAETTSVRLGDEVKQFVGSMEANLHLAIGAAITETAKRNALFPNCHRKAGASQKAVRPKNLFRAIRVLSGLLSPLSLYPPPLAGGGVGRGRCCHTRYVLKHADDWRSRGEITRLTAPLSCGVRPPRPYGQAAQMVSLGQSRGVGRTRCLRAVLGPPELEPLAANDDVEAHRIVPELQRCACSWPRSRAKGEPGYWERHDADEDGIACEPLPRRWQNARHDAMAAPVS